jgi:hypothetical protein
MDITKKSGFINGFIVLFLTFALVLAAPASAYADVDDEDTDGDDPASAENNTEVSLVIVSAPATMNVGERAVIDYELKGANTGSVVAWTSSNDSVAAVDSMGEVVASSPGSVEITASVTSLGLRTSTMIRITEISATSVAIGVKEYSDEDMLLSEHEMTVDDVLHLFAVVEPDNVTTAPEIQWSSSNTKVLAVDANGKVTALAEGGATVTAKADGLTDRMKFNVNPLPGSAIDDYLLIGFCVLVAIIIVIVIIIIVRAAKRRRAAREAIATRSEAADELKRKIRNQEAAKKEREPPLTDRRTRVFAAPEDAAPAEGAGTDDPLLAPLPDESPPDFVQEGAEAAGTLDERAEGYEDGPDRPFSLDDID